MIPGGLRALTAARLPLLLTLCLAAPLATLNIIGWIRFTLHRALEGDFAFYYAFARIGLESGWAHLYDLAAQRQQFDALGLTLWYPIPFPPPLAWFVAPFALFPFPVALALWNALLLGALLLAWWLAAPGSRLERTTHLVVAFALFPVAFGLLLGQVVVVLAAAVALSWWLLRRGRDLAAGLVLGILLLKPHLGALIPFALLAAGRRRAFGGWVAAAAALVALSVLSLGPSGTEQYLNRLLSTGQSLAGYKVEVELTLVGLLGSGRLAVAAQLVVAAVTLALAFRRRRQGSETAIVTGVVGSLLITPFVHDQDLTLLLPAAWLYLRTQPARWERVAAAVAFLATMVLGTPLVLVLLAAAWAATLVRPAARRLPLAAPAPSGAG